jgi:catechol 2,3-dioxygenase-like lactoylglutathione lyase family enzyme
VVSQFAGTEAFAMVRSPPDALVRIQRETWQVPVELDHVIVPVNDAAESLRFYTDVLGFGDDGFRPPFTVVRVSDRCTLQLAPWGTDGHMHLAFAMTPAEFDQAFTRVRTAGVPFGDTFHDSANMRGPGDEDGARGPGKAIYLMDPNQHLIELRHYTAT